MEIDTASESLNNSVESTTVLSLSSAALSIADELADRERRKTIPLFIISLKHLTIKEIRIHLQTSAFLFLSIMGTLINCFAWERKFQINTDPYFWALKIMRTRVYSFLVHISCSTMINDVFISLLTELNLKGKNIGS